MGEIIRDDEMLVKIYFDLGDLYLYAVFGSPKIQSAKDAVDIL